MTVPQLGRPVGASGEQTRTRIINATMRCVAQVGVSRATIREIARMADVTSASLYNYFPNKAELLRAAIEARTELAMPRLRRAAQHHGTVTDRIEALLDESGKLMREYPDLASFEWAIRSEGASVTSAVQFQELRHIVEEIVDDGRRQGALSKSTDARAVVEVIYALLYGLTELAAGASSRTYYSALDGAKKLVRGTLFESSEHPDR